MNKKYRTLLIGLIFVLTAVFGRIVYATDGSIDQAFNSNGSGGQAAGFNGAVQIVQIQDDTNKIIVSGGFTQYNGVAVGGIVRLNDDGTIDTTFNSNGSGGQLSGFNGAVSNSDVQVDDKILITGNFTQYDGVAVPRIVRLNPNGTLDTTFNTNLGTGFNSNTRGVVQETVTGPDYGKIVVAGTFTGINGSSAKYLARLNADGTPDTAFNANIGAVGFSGGSGGSQRIGIQSNGKIIVGGQFTVFNGHTVNRITRLNSDGTWDATFNTGGTSSNGSVYAINVLSNDKILIGGNLNTFNGVSTGYMMRLNADGTLDTSFNSGGVGAVGEIDALFVQPNGKIIVEGTAFTKYNGVTVNYIARLNEDGTLDSSFNSGTGFNAGTTNGVHGTNSIFRSNGNIVLNGNFTSYNGTPVGYIVSLQTDITNPVVSNIHLSSNNSNSQYAKTGDVVTLSFTSNHPLVSSIITMGNQSVTPSCVAASGVSVNCTASLTITSLVPVTDGDISFAITETTVGGTTGPVTITSDNSSVTIIRSNPSVPTITVGSPTADHTPTISGSCTDGNVVSVMIGGITVTDLCSGGNYSVIWSSLVDNTYVIRSFQTDNAGNQSAIVSSSVTVDTTAPTVTIDNPVDHTLFGSGIISGTCESGLTITLSGTGFSPTGTTSCTGGTYSFNVTVTANMTITISQTDLVHNTGSATASISAVYPAPTFSNIHITSNNSNSQYAKTGDTVTLSFDSNYPLTSITSSIGGTSVNPVCSGSGPVTCTAILAITDSVPVADGNSSVSITGSTGGGSTGPITITSDGSSVTMLRQEPGRPTISFISPTHDTTPTVSGTCVNGDLVFLQVNNQVIHQLCSGGVYAITLDPLVDGTYTVGVYQKDPAGNDSDDQVIRTLVVDTQSPIVSITSPNDKTATGNQTITGVCESGLDVSISGTGFSPTGTTPCNDRTFSYSVTISSSGEIAASQTDAAGNTGVSTVNIIAIYPRDASLSGGRSLTTDATVTFVAKVDPQVCVPYLTQKISTTGYHYGSQVAKLIVFLNTHEHEVLISKMTYSKSVILAVKRFQQKYASDILAPAHITMPSGIVSTYTIKKINALMCQ